MNLAPQLAFNGQCREAFEFYATLFDGEITVLNTFGDHADAALPPGSTAGPDEHVRFGEVRFGDTTLRGNDVEAERFEPMRGFSLSLHIPSEHEARRIFAALGQDGTIATPLTAVAWAKLFGMLTDRFGVPWLILAI